LSRIKPNTDAHSSISLFLLLLSSFQIHGLPRFKSRCPGVRTSETLQWGHAFSDVEISIVLDPQKVLMMLQWGHVFSDVEISFFSSSGFAIYPGFNGATSFQTWK